METDGFEGWTKVLGRLAAGADLTSAESRGALAEVLAGGATSAQLAAFIVALRLKGETAEEITGLVEAMVASRRGSSRPATMRRTDRAIG